VKGVLARDCFSGFENRARTATRELPVLLHPSESASRMRAVVSVVSTTALNFSILELAL
jgi:hypothetical protein